MREKRSIPPDVDRSLLQDLTIKSGNANHVRRFNVEVQLRARFWEAVQGGDPRILS